METESGVHIFPERRACTGKAALFTLASIDRIDHPGGLGYGPPGGKATKLLGCTDTGDDVDMTVAFELGSRFILYAVEELGGPSPFFVFLELDSLAIKEKLIREEAFIDRGARMVATVGLRVLVASLETIETYIKTAELESPIKEGRWNLSIVWNTGRCGSTLMHKALLACGVGSFSEPQWLDQLCFTEAGKVEPLLLTRAFKACWVLDIHLLRFLPSFKEATMFSLNPKTSAWLLSVGEAFTDAFPRLRHCFMYRACDKVAESFFSLDNATVPAKKLEEEDAVWKQKGSAMFHHMVTDSIKPLLISGEMPLCSIESCSVARRTLGWLRCMNAWRGMQACSNAFAQAPVVRMDEFVSKDLAKREAILREILSRLDVLKGEGDAQIHEAMEVFNENSQKNSAMGGAKKGGLSEKCRSAIFECIAKAGPLIPDLIVERDGANALLPGSLGTSAADRKEQVSKKPRCADVI